MQSKGWITAHYNHCMLPESLLMLQQHMQQGHEANIWFKEWRGKMLQCTLQCYFFPRIFFVCVCVLVKTTEEPPWQIRAHTHTNTHLQSHKHRDIHRKNMQSHTVAQWGEGFNKPTVTWIYGGVSGPSQETRWMYLPSGTEGNSKGWVGGLKWRAMVCVCMCMGGGSEATGTLSLSLPWLFLSSAISLFTRPLCLCSHHQPQRKPCPQTLMCLSEKMPNHFNSISCHLHFHQGLGVCSSVG